TVVLQGDLALGVRAEEIYLAGLAHVGHPPHQLVRIHDRRRHQLGRLVDGVAEHQALVARALLLVGAFALGHALRDVGRLRLDRREHAARLPVEAHRRARVADVFDRAAREPPEIHARLRRDLTADDHEARLAEGLASDAAQRILLQASIEHGVGNGIANLVGMSLADRLRSKQVTRHERGFLSSKGPPAGADPNTIAPSLTTASHANAELL